MRGFIVLFGFLGLVILSYCGPSVECSKHADCVSDKKFCSDGKCVQCRNDGDCAKNEVCKGDSCTKNQDNKEKIIELFSEKKIQEKVDESVKDNLEPKSELKPEPNSKIVVLLFKRIN